MRKINKKNAPLEAFLVDPESLGVYLRQVRLEAGLTQSEAAGLCNVGTRFLNELENGKTTAALGKVMHVLKGYGIQFHAIRRRQRENF
jgi:transcriptional regulator with XRE-family HTH domain